MPLNYFQVSDGSLTMGRAAKSGAINHGTDPHILKINGPIRSKRRMVPFFSSIID